MIIGICGKSGSGKSTLARLIEESRQNTVYLDIDKIGHLSHKDSDVIEKLKNAFGKEIVNSNIVNRKSLSSLVFSNESNMQKLIEITWPFMEKEIQKFINCNNDKDIILDWQLLPKVSFFNKCNIKILLDIPYDIRKKRILERDNISEMEFELRDSASTIYDKTQFDIVITDDNFNRLKEFLKKYDKSVIS